MLKSAPAPKLPRKAYAAIAIVALGTFGALVEGYQLLFYSTPFA